MDSMTEEFYFSEYISTGYSQSALVNTYQNYNILSNDTYVMIFNMTEKLPVKLSQFLVFKFFKVRNNDTRLIHFGLMSLLYNCWEHHKNKGFLIFSGSTEKEHMRKYLPKVNNKGKRTISMEIHLLSL